MFLKTTTSTESNDRKMISFWAPTRQTTKNKNKPIRMFLLFYISLKRTLNLQLVDEEIADLGFIRLGI